MPAGKIIYQSMPPVIPPATPLKLSAERLAYNVKMNLILDGKVVPAVAPDGSTEMSNFIDVLCACIINEISTFGYAESVVLVPGTGAGSPVPVPDTLPADGPGHVHAHLHSSPATALRFQTTSAAIPA